MHQLFSLLLQGFKVLLMPSESRMMFWGKSAFITLKSSSRAHCMPAPMAVSGAGLDGPWLAISVRAAFRSVEPEIALFALGALGQGGQRTLGAFCWRRWLCERLRPLVDDERAAVLRDHIKQLKAEE